MIVEDGILNKERIVQAVYDPESARCLLEDKNSNMVLEFLLDGPMTFEDIRKAFREAKLKRSDKTIYGYLNKLKSAKLIMEAGKRVIKTEDSMKTLTLYSRTARAYYIAVDIEELGTDLEQQYISTVKAFVLELLNKQEIKDKCFQKTYELLKENKREAIKELNAMTDPKFLEMLKSFDMRSVRYVIDLIVWLRLLGANPNIGNEFTKCLD